MVTIRNIVINLIYIESVITELMFINDYLNCTFIHVLFFLHSSYRQKYLKEEIYHKYYTELHLKMDVDIV
jgi:hypothetical protein